MKMTAEDFVQKIKTAFPDIVEDISEFRGEFSCLISDAMRIHDVAQYVCNDLGFDLLKDMTSVDETEAQGRYYVVYELFSFTHRVQIRLKTYVPKDAPKLDSVTDLWNSANWQEREIFDMMGIQFRNHPNLQRILMWNDFPYHPLRKDFPVAGKETDSELGIHTEAAPWEGGPFVTKPGVLGTNEREPRSKEN